MLRDTGPPPPLLPPPRPHRPLTPLKPPRRTEKMASPPPRVLLGVTGSVAAVKYERLCLLLQPFCEVRVIHTGSGSNFQPLCKTYSPLDHAAFQGIIAAATDAPVSSEAGAVRECMDAGGNGSGDSSGSGGSPPPPFLFSPPPSVVRHYSDADEWRDYGRVGVDPVLHIELRKWADVLVIAPCTANTLAKLAGGLADNLLTCVARAWEFGVGGRVAKPFLLAPAMNTCMWEHPVTAQHLGTLQGWGVLVIPPIEKVLACGDKGVGAMAEVDTLVAAIKLALVSSRGRPA